MLNHAAETPVDFHFIFSTIGTLSTPHSAHFVSSGASRQLIDPAPRSFSELLWALCIIPFSATKCLPMTRSNSVPHLELTVRKTRFFQCRS